MGSMAVIVSAVESATILVRATAIAKATSSATILVAVRQRRISIDRGEEKVFV